MENASQLPQTEYEISVEIENPESPGLVKEKIFKKSGSKYQYYSTRQVIDGCDLDDIYYFDAVKKKFKFKKNIVDFEKYIDPNLLKESKQYHQNFEKRYELQPDGYFLFDEGSAQDLALFGLIPNVQVYKIYNAENGEFLGNEYQNFHDGYPTYTSRIQNYLNNYPSYNQNIVRKMLEKISKTYVIKKNRIKFIFREPFKTNLQYTPSIQVKNIQKFEQDQSQWFNIPYHYIKHINIEVESIKPIPMIKQFQQSITSPITNYFKEMLQHKDSQQNEVNVNNNNINNNKNKNNKNNKNNINIKCN